MSEYSVTENQEEGHKKMIEGRVHLVLSYNAGDLGDM